ncbi:unnamed protein product [Anisakis simplex]|uniref:26S proteasome complex subunit dss-1 n=1 Tax=Anisakis simplex TaxID=6269 RepID=A0A0M3JYC3_ANISI|nr:unnamed protein product [Anisakis simplex]
MRWSIAVLFDSSIMTDKKKDDKEKEEPKKIEMQSVEEDDEFEEFPLQDWQAKENAEEEEELSVWEDNWDDEAHENDFSKQLRDELAKSGSKAIV